MKPVAAGSVMTADGLRNDDAVGLMADSNVIMPYETVNPYCLPAPVSPHLAARAAGVTIELPRLQASFAALGAAADFVIVEGAGGWFAPLNEHEFVADLAAALGLPVVLVVGLRLGCLNHALLTAAAIRQHGADPRRLDRQSHRSRVQPRGGQHRHVDPASRHGAACQHRSCTGAGCDDVSAAHRNGCAGAAGNA